MVDVTLTTLDKENLPHCYIATRFGDTQKLGRLSPEKLYRFPEGDLGEQKCAFIDVFQRVGGCKVNYEPEERDQLVTLPMRSGQNLSLRVNVAAAAGKKPRENIPRASDKLNDPIRQRLMLAKSYMAKHNLETRLKLAVQSAMETLPDDPITFICAKLMESKGGAQSEPTSITAFSSDDVPTTADATSGSASHDRTDAGETPSSDTAAPTVSSNTPAEDSGAKALSSQTAPADIVSDDAANGSRGLPATSDGASTATTHNLDPAKPDQAVGSWKEADMAEKPEPRDSPGLAELRDRVRFVVNDKVEMWSNLQRRWCKGEIVTASDASDSVAVTYVVGTSTQKRSISRKHRNIRHDAEKAGFNGYWTGGTIEDCVLRDARYRRKGTETYASIKGADMVITSPTTIAMCLDENLSLGELRIDGRLEWFDGEVWDKSPQRCTWETDEPISQVGEEQSKGPEAPAQSLAIPMHLAVREVNKESSSPPDGQTSASSRLEDQASPELEVKASPVEEVSKEGSSPPEGQTSASSPLEDQASPPLEVKASPVEGQPSPPKKEENLRVEACQVKPGWWELTVRSTVWTSCSADRQDTGTFLAEGKQVEVLEIGAFNNVYHYGRIESPIAGWIFLGNDVVQGFARPIPVDSTTDITDSTTAAATSASVSEIPSVSPQLADVLSGSPQPAETPTLSAQPSDVPSASSDPAIVPSASSQPADIRPASSQPVDAASASSERSVVRTNPAMPEVVFDIQVPNPKEWEAMLVEAKNNGTAPFEIGDIVEVCDNNHCSESGWKPACVTSVQPLQVQVDGFKGSTTWDKVRMKASKS